MKDKVHPEYKVINVRCACGATFQTRSTLCRDFQVDICAVCHPFYTGKQKFVDTAGRVEKFQKKFGGQYFKKPVADAPKK
jgi:large subunit ribosomal protein L31